MLQKIRLYGALAKFVGKRVLLADVASAAEAVRYLIANWPELEQHMIQYEYQVKVGGIGIDQSELHYPSGRQEIKIIPVVSGAGGATGRIIAGVALVTLSLLFAPAGALASSAFTLGATAVNIGVGIGVSLILGGVAQMLTPTPKLNTKKESDPRESYSFSGIQNVSRQGVPVPIIYGEIMTGSVVVSAEIDVEQR